MAAMFHGLAFGGGSLVGDASDAFSACDCVPGEVPERSIGAVSKTVVPFAGYRGFESLPLRQTSSTSVYIGSLDTLRLASWANLG
jgi:hypothetical protein